MTKTESMGELESSSRKILFLLFVMYVASTIIFARPDNFVYSNIANVLLIGYFGLHQLFFPLKTYHFNTLLLIYISFVLYTILSIIWTIDYHYSQYIVVRLIMIALNLIILYNIIKVYKFQEAFFIGMMLGTFFNGLLAFGVIHVNFPIFFPGGVRFMGTTINPNIIGGMVLFSLMGSILYLQYAKNRFWIGMHLLNILLGYYLILMTVSRTSLVITSGILAIFTLQLLLKKGTRTYLLLFILLATMIMISFVDLDALMVKVSFALKRIGYIIQALSGHGTEHSADERLAFIQIALGVFYENPIFGTGINTMRVFLGGLYSHNNYVELLATTGLVGATLYYSLYFTLVKNLWNLTDIWIKIYISLFIFAILLFDLAGVTYYSKPVLTMLLVFSYLVEEKGKSFQQNDDV